VLEPESNSLAAHLRQHRSRVSCALAGVEMVRAVRSYHGRPAINRAQALLARISLLRLDDALLDEAATLDRSAALPTSMPSTWPPLRRSATGSRRSSPTDHRMGEAARQLGLQVVAPA
jgi:hypothetical protein